MTKKRRYFISAAVLAACVGMAWVVFAMLPPRPGVTKANFDRIENGMTLAESQSIFGCGPNLFIDHWRLGRVGYGWTGSDGSKAFIDISSERVSGKQWVPSTETIPDKIRRWLHLPK